MDASEKDWALSTLIVVGGQLNVMQRQVREAGFPDDAKKIGRVAERLERLQPIIESIPTKEKPADYVNPLAALIAAMTERSGDV